MNNIAEGFERKSNNEFKQFLYFSKGSCGEVRSMLYLAKEIDYINDESFNKLYTLAEEISKMLSGLIQSLNSKKNYWTFELLNFFTKNNGYSYENLDITSISKYIVIGLFKYFIRPLYLGYSSGSNQDRNVTGEDR